MRGKSRSSSRSSKRKNEVESSGSEPKSKRASKKNEHEQNVDKYCWLCHVESNDKICVTCHRVYHTSCLEKTKTSFSDLGVCPECQLQSVCGTELNFNRFLSLDKLKKMLDALTRRSFKKKREKKEIFLRWPEEDRDNLFKIVDFEILLDNINYVLPYTTTAEFYSDVKFIYHNACIAYGANSDQSKAAENLRRDFMAELLDLEACPECYYYLYCDEVDHHDPFVRICDIPHDIVWAQLTGHPYWPAKCLKTVKGMVKGKEMAHVRFFGEHEQANVPIGKCLFISEKHPTVKMSNVNKTSSSGGPKSQRYLAAKAELLEYIQLYRRMYASFPFYPHKTPYDPSKKQQEVAIRSAEGSYNRKLVQMKLEGNVNEDVDMYNINTTRVVEDSEDNLTFQNGVTNNIPAPNGTGTEGQCPTLAQINPSIDPNPSEGSVAEGQYTTFAVLNDCINPSLPPSQDSLNKNPSAVTSINMTFATDESSAQPVVTSIDSLPLSNTASNIHSSAPLNVAAHIDRKIEKFRSIESNPSDPEGTETVCSITVANITSNSSPIHRDSMHNKIMDHFPIYTGNQTELDDEVHIIGTQNVVEANGDINPDVVLPMLMEENPELKSLVQKTRYMSDAMIVQLYASLGSNSNNMGKMSKLCVDLRKCRADLRKALEENDKFRKEDKTNKYTIQRLNDTVNKLEAEIRELQSKNMEAAKNARMVISGLKSGCSKRIEEMYRNQFITTLNEKDDCILKKEKQLKDAEEMLKNLEEQKRCLKTELEEMKVEKQKTEEELRATKKQIEPDTISEYKRTHYCCVCERSAGKTCCLNTSYCSEECEKRHAEEHRKHCRNKTTSQSIVQQRVFSQQSVVMVSHGVITSGRSHMNNPSNSAVSNSRLSSSTDRKPQIHRFPPSPLLPTPRYSSSASSSRSYSSKSRRRSNK